MLCLVDPPAEFAHVEVFAEGGVKRPDGVREIHYRRRLFRRSPGSTELLLISAARSTQPSFAPVTDGPLLDLARVVNVSGFEVDPESGRSEVQPTHEVLITERLLAARNATGRRLIYARPELDRVNFLVEGTIIDIIGWLVPLTDALLRTFRISSGTNRPPTI